MAKYLFIGFLIIAISAQYIYKIAVITNYFLNQEAITNMYCVNKDKPSMKCNGKCHLNNKINIQEKSQNDNANNHPLESLKKIFENFAFCYELQKSSTFDKGIAIREEKYFDIKKLHSYLLYFDQLKPPQ